MSKVISVANNKGGSGKTTTAVHVAQTLATDASVLLIDADPQASASAWRAAQNEVLIPFEVSAMAKPILHTQVPAMLAHSNYDYVIIDCPPGGSGQGSNGQQTRSALWISDLVIIPLMPSALDYWAADPMIQLVQELRISRPSCQARLLINRKAPRTVMGRQASEQAAELFQMELFRTEISQRQSLINAIAGGLTVNHIEPKSPATEDYENLCKEIKACLTFPALHAAR